MAVNPATHPSTETLRALGLGKLDDADAEAVLSHLGNCPDCCRKTATLPGDTFLDRLRDVHQRAESPAPAGAPSEVTLGSLAPGTPEGEGPVAGPKVSRFPQDFPASFGRYRILKLLGKGGMGAVYLAHDTQLDRPVALKIPHFEAADGPQMRERFYREARAAATLQHPNICPLHDVGEIDGTPYLTMAYVEGKPLAAFAAARPLTARQSALLVRKLALALQEAHKRGVIHRDLKPDNVMIDRRGEPIIMDFGLARRTRAGDPRLTQRGSILGTPAYMPPEQVSGDVEATGPASDVYSLGVILYELLTGRLPFSGDAMAMLSQVLLDEPPPPSRVCEGLDPGLEAVCLKAMAKKVEDRYASMADLAAALGETLRGRPPAPEPAAPAAAAGARAEAGGIRTSRMGGLRSVAMVHAQPPAREAGADKPRRPRPRRPARRRVPAWAWLTGAGVGAALLLVGLWAAGVFKVKTKDGTIVVENVPADAEVQVEGQTVTLTRNGEVVTVSAVAEGPHRLKVVQGGKEVWLSDVTVKLGADPVRLKLEGGKREARTEDRGEELRLIRWPREENIYTANFSPDGGRCLISGDKGTLLYDVQTGKPVGKEMTGYISAWVPGGERIITGQKTRSVFRVYDSGGNGVRSFEGQDDLWNFSVSPRGDRVLAMGPGGDRLLDLKDGTQLAKWPRDGDQTESLFSPDGRHVLRKMGRDRPWQVYSAGTGEEAKALDHPGADAEPSLLFANGLRAFGGPGERRLYSATSGKELGKLDFGGSPPRAATLSPDGRRLLTYHADRKVRLWELAGGRVIGEFSTLNANKIHHMTLSFSPDGRYACAGGAPGWVYLWRLPKPSAEPLQRVAPGGRP